MLSRVWHGFWKPLQGAVLIYGTAIKPFPNYLIMSSLQFSNRR
jgi:hypothetical protein